MGTEDNKNDGMCEKSEGGKRIEPKRKNGEPTPPLPPLAPLAIQNAVGLREKVTDRQKHREEEQRQTQKEKIGRTTGFDS